MRFSLAHPQWRPPGHSSKFLGHLRGRVQQDAAAWGATSVRSPPTPRVLSDSSSPLVSHRLAAPISLPSASPLARTCALTGPACSPTSSVLSSDRFFLFPAGSLPGQPLGAPPHSPTGPEPHGPLPSCSHCQPLGLHFPNCPGPQVRRGDLRCQGSRGGEADPPGGGCRVQGHWGD